MKKLIATACIMCFGFVGVNGMAPGEGGQDWRARWSAEHASIMMQYRHRIKAEEAARPNAEDIALTTHYYFGYRDERPEPVSLVWREGETVSPELAQMFQLLGSVLFPHTSTDRSAICITRFCNTSALQYHGINGDRTEFTLSDAEPHDKELSQINWPIDGVFAVNIRIDTPESIKNKMINNLGCNSAVIVMHDNYSTDSRRYRDISLYAAGHEEVVNHWSGWFD